MSFPLLHLPSPPSSVDWCQIWPALYFSRFGGRVYTLAFRPGCGILTLKLALKWAFEISGLNAINLENSLRRV